MGSLNNTTIAATRGDFKPLDLQDFRKEVDQTVDFICNYYQNIETYPVLPQVQHGYLGQLLPKTPPYQPETFDAILKDVNATIIPGMTHWASPNFFAYFPATTSSAALSADLLASALNPVAFTWMASPAVTELETISLDWLAQLLKLPECFHSSGTGGGVIQTSTTEVMLCTLVAARDRALKRVGYENAGKLTVYSSDQTHTTFSKACRIVGILPTNIRSIKTFPDSEFALSASKLRSQMESDVAKGLVPIYVCATVGSTSSTAVDSVGAIADVAREHGAWVNVDAAYAGSACICPEFRHHLDGVERVDSLSTSPHKWLLTGLDCCCLWVRDRALFTSSLGSSMEVLRNEPSESRSVVDFKDWQLGVGRRFRGLRLYFVIRCYGVAALQSHIRSDVRMARAFEMLVGSDPWFEVVVPRRFSLVCFRLRPRGDVGLEDGEAEGLNRRLMNAVNESGRVFITHTVLGGVYVLRFAVGTTLTEDRHVLSAWELIKEKADGLLRAREKLKVMA